MVRRLVELHMQRAPRRAAVITLLPARKEQAVSVTADLDHERDHVRSGAQDEADLGDFTRSIVELDRAGAIKAFRLETSL